MRELHPLADRVLRFILEEELIHYEDHVLAGVSGGADSVALLAVLASLRRHLELSKITVVHFDHQLRGEASRQDRVFAQSLAARFGFPFYCETQNVEAYRRKNRVSVEMAARTCRHRFFQTARQKLNAHKIALGHTANDQAEEMLLRLFRGTGPSGLAGMRPSTRDGIIRPMLFVTRNELLGYLEAEGIDFREDASNLEPFCQRNALRIELFPFLERRFHSRVVENLYRHAALVQSEEGYWSNKVQEKWPLVSIEETPLRIDLSIPKLLELHPALRSRILRSAIERLQGRLSGIYAVHVELLSRLMTADSSRSHLHLPGSLRAAKERDALVLSKGTVPVGSLSTSSSAEVLTGPGRFTFPDLGMCLYLKEIGWSHEAPPMERSPDTAWLDAEKLCWPLTVRFWRRGDRFQPLGLHGRSKKLQDFFVDAKIPREKRRLVPLLCDAEKICWIIGYRLSERVKVTHRTRTVLFARWKAWSESSLPA